MIEKDSFILHKDSLKILDKMSDLQVARLFRAIKDYHEGKTPVLDDALSLVFVSFENQFERDAQKYAARCERNRNNAKQASRSKARPLAADSDLEPNPVPDNDPAPDNKDIIGEKRSYRTYARKRSVADHNREVLKELEDAL